MTFHVLHATMNLSLKASMEKIPLKVNDGAYESMIKRILDTNNPHFFFLGYDQHYCVINCFAVPNYLYQPSCIEKRKPFALTAKRAGWVGCFIKLDQIPKIDKINLIENGNWVRRGLVKNAWNKTKF